MSEATMSISRRARFTRFATALALLLSVGALAACNTMEGAGEDISAGGEKLNDAAEDAQD